MPIARLLPLLPPALLALACGGVAWAAWAALVLLVLAIPLADHLLPGEAPSAGGRPVLGLARLGAALHLPLLFAGIWALSSGYLTGATAVAFFVALGLSLGQIAMSAAHELIHAPHRGDRMLGALLFSALLFGHHASAHPRVHHRLVATPEDPNTARPGTSVYRFLPRAWVGSLTAGLAAEVRRLNAQGRSGWHPENPYWGYGIVALAAVLLAQAFGGGTGVALLAGLAGYATLQLLVTDYVQHFGLSRKRTAQGYEPIGPQHSWDAPHPVSDLLMLGAPQHSNHHLGPLPRRSGEAAPRLPYSLPVMATLAFLPTVFARAMRRPLAALDRPAPADLPATGVHA